LGFQIYINIEIVDTKKKKKFPKSILIYFFL